MGKSWNGKIGVVAGSLGIAIGMLLSMGLAGAGFASGAAAPATEPVVPAVNQTQQWAFGGTASISFSCLDATCFGGTPPPNETLSLSYHYTISWAVIYTQINVSGSQTEEEIEAGISVSASVGFSFCETNGTTSCTVSTSLSASIGGTETSGGATNLTDGTVDQTNATAGPTGNVSGLAVTNASSHAGFNFSGSYSVTSTNGSGSANFDIGGSEHAGISFGTPLGIVPSNPVAGDTWNDTAPYTASGSWVSGYDVSVAGYPTPVINNWTGGSVGTSGNLTVNGTDLGSITLWDNYTTPHTSVTAQEIELDFVSGNFTGEDGWLMVPTDLFAGLGGIALSAPVASGPLETLAAPQANLTASADTNESAFYEHGVGFVGASAAGNTTLPGAPSGAAGPSVQLSAGPEPLSVAEQQYNAILTFGSKTGGSSLPVEWIAIGAVAVVVVAGAGVFAWRRMPSRPQPPTGGPQGGPAAGSPSGPTAWNPPSQPGSPPPTAPNSGAPGQGQ